MERTLTPRPRTGLVRLAGGWLLLLALTAAALLPRHSQAQPTPAFCGNAAPAAVPALAFTTTFQTTPSQGAGATLYWRFRAVAGATYSFSACNSAIIFPEVRVYNGAGTVVSSSTFPYTINPYCPGVQKGSLDWTCPAGAGGT